MNKTRQRTKKSTGYEVQSTKGQFMYASGAWGAASPVTQGAFNSLAVKMQQAGLLAPGFRQTGYTLFMQMSRAVQSVYGTINWGSGSAAAVPDVPLLPPSVPKFTVTATQTANGTLVHLNAAAFACGCQVQMSPVFVPGCCDPFKQRTRIVGSFPGGWPDGGRDLNALLDNLLTGYKFRAAPGTAFVIKIVPVTRDGFVGPSLSEVCVVE